MPQVNVASGATSTVAVATRDSGPLEGSLINRGPNSAWLEITDPAANVTASAGAGNAAEVKLGEGIDFRLDRGEAIRARCAAAETARLDVIQSAVT